MNSKHLNWSFCLVLSLLTSCSTDHPKPAELVGTWELTEQYFDPGNGSGTFAPVTSDKTITFLTDGHFTSNGTMCTINSASDNALHTGTYLLADSTITPDCSAPNTKIFFKIKDRSLILSYLCIEPCQQKYVKLLPD